MTEVRGYLKVDSHMPVEGMPVFPKGQQLTQLPLVTNEEIYPPSYTNNVIRAQLC